MVDSKHAQAGGRPRDPWRAADADRAAVAARLGRPPHGRFRVVVRDAAGLPAVIETHPVVFACDGTPEPFPTTHWLVDPARAAAVGRLESAGAIAELDAELAADDSLAARWAADHRRLIAYRLSLLTPAERDALAAAGRLEPLQNRGIAGVADFLKVKCLHAVLAHHLAVGNAPGPWIERRLARR